MIRITALSLTFLLTACAYHSPYINPTYVAPDKTLDKLSVRERSAFHQNTLIAEANALTNTNLYSTSLLAGTLGFGAYKVLTGGAEHQIAALATGSGVIYGYQQALYNETVAGILIEAADQLACIDTIYTMPTTAEGDSVKERLSGLAPDIWDALNPSYAAAVAKIEASDRQYEANVNRVIYLANKKRSNLQLSTAQSYALISTSISSSAPATPPDQAQLNQNTIAASTTQIKKNDGSYESSVDDQKKNEIIKLLTQYKSWIDNVNASVAEFDPDKITACKTSNAPPTIPGTDPNTAIIIKPNETHSYKVNNSSGNLNASSNQRDSSGNSYLSTIIKTDSGNYFLEVTGKVSSNNKPVTVYVTDLGKEEATRIIKFIVQ